MLEMGDVWRRIQKSGRLTELIMVNSTIHCDILKSTFTKLQNIHLLLLLWIFSYVSNKSESYFKKQNTMKWPWQCLMCLKSALLCFCAAVVSEAFHCPAAVQNRPIEHTQSLTVQMKCAMANYQSYTPREYVFMWLCKYREMETERNRDGV